MSRRLATAPMHDIARAVGTAYQPAARAKVVEVSLSEPLRPIAVEERYGQVFLAVKSAQGTYVGSALLPAEAVIAEDAQAAVISATFGDALTRERLRAEFDRVARRSAERLPDGKVSVVVPTRDRPDELTRCLESLSELETQPLEILVVDNCPTSDRTRSLCAQYPVRYVREPFPGTARAKNRGVVEAAGDFIAFIDDDCVADRAWLDGLGGAFADPLVMAVTGATPPLELATPAQYLFELHGGFVFVPTHRVFDAFSRAAMLPGVCPGGNAIIRRNAFEDIGLFAEDVGSGTPARAGEDTAWFSRAVARGHRIGFDPSRIVWHRHRADYDSLRRQLFGYGAGASAYFIRSLVRHGEIVFARFWLSWLRHLSDTYIRALLGRHPLPPRLALAELAGTLVGPLLLRRSIRSRRGIPPLELPRSKPSPGIEPVSVLREEPPVSVVVCAEFGHENLARLLRSLARQTLSPERFEVVVVGRAGSRRDVARALHVPYPLRLVEEKTDRTAAQRNRVISEASFPVVLFLAEDLVPEPSLLAEHARVHGEGTDDVVFGYCKPVLPAGRGLWHSLVTSQQEDHFRRKRQARHQWTFADFTGANVSLPRSLLYAVGGFDEAFETPRMDWELGLRLLRDGARFGCCGTARVSHDLDTSLRDALMQRRLEACDDIVLVRKHPEIAQRLPVYVVARVLAKSSRARLAYCRPRLIERTTRLTLPLASAYESAGLRESWRRLANRLMRQAYYLGLAGALPSPHQVVALVASNERPPKTVPVWLDGEDPLEIRSDTGVVELEVGLFGTSLARVVPLETEEQWDWDVVRERVVDAMAPHLAKADLPAS